MVLTTYPNTGGLIIYSAPCLSTVCLSGCICSDFVCRHSEAYCLLFPQSVCSLSTCLYLFWLRMQTQWNLLSALPLVCLSSVYLFVSVLTTYPDTVKLVVCSAPCLSELCLPVCVCSDDVSRRCGTCFPLCPLSVCCLSVCLYLFWRLVQTLCNLLHALLPVCLLSVYLFVSVLKTCSDAV